MIYTAATVTALNMLTPSLNDVCILTDKWRGGTFICRSGSASSDVGNTFTSASPGLYWSRLYQGEVQASWYGAIPDGKITGTTISGTDSSPSLKSALFSLFAYPVNNFYGPLKRKVKLNNGDYLINDAISVRKGQYLSGEGMGVTILTGGTTSASEKTHILFGYKINADGSRGDFDDYNNGLPASISDLTIRGTQTDRSALFTNLAGIQVERVEFYKGGIGVDSNSTAADTYIHSCIFRELDSIAIRYSTFGALITNCSFYNSVFGIFIRGGANPPPDANYSDRGSNDNQISNCLFAFNRPDSEIAGDRWAIRLSAPNGDRVANILINHCTFTYSGSNLSQVAVIYLGALYAMSTKIANCQFNNWSGWAISDESVNPPGSIVSSIATYINDCHFNGNPSSPSYAKAQNGSTNLSKGIRLRSGTYFILDCTFENIYTDATTGVITLENDKGVELYISSHLASLVVNKGATQNHVHPV